MSSLAEVRLWGTTVGAVRLDERTGVAAFEYDPGFARRGIELAPLEMPLEAARTYSFPGLSAKSFHGLPGLLADSLPDRYGNALIDAWLATRGEDAEDFDAVRRLCYIGRRGMGALEFAPAAGPKPSASHVVDVEALAELAAEVLANRADLAVSLQQPGKREAMREILRVGTSAGGARAKALIALDPKTNEVRSGQLEAPPGFEYWILKFDGVEDQSRDLGASRGYGVVEWVYSRMARQAGIEMTECRLLEEGNRRHFMTRRFDRDAHGSKLHMQSLAALAHLDFNQPGANSYEQAFQAIRRLGLPQIASEQQFRRMAFNVVARNQDDHVKNVAFLMDRDGAWSLSPAFDVVYAFNPDGRQTAHHQMSIAGKRDGFTFADLRSVADLASLKRGQPEEILAQVTDAVEAWPELAAAAGLDERRIERIRRAQRLALPRG
ncbi:MAG: type II toxin-antitoxin system HipA family toxin [Solirubrobacterales bacterium]|nr:type II toxin-antitoxin system HipA family toxin [Solirubrobacterales bacterium]